MHSSKFVGLFLFLNTCSYARYASVRVSASISISCTTVGKLLRRFTIHTRQGSQRCSFKGFALGINWMQRSWDPDLWQKVIVPKGIVVTYMDCDVEKAPDALRETCAKGDQAKLNVDKKTVSTFPKFYSVFATERLFLTYTCPHAALWNAPAVLRVIQVMWNWQVKDSQQRF